LPLDLKIPVSLVLGDITDLPTFQPLGPFPIAPTEPQIAFNPSDNKDVNDKLIEDAKNAFQQGANIFSNALSAGFKDGAFNIKDALLSAGKSVADLISQQLLANEASGFGKNFAAGGLGVALGGLNPLNLILGLGLPLLFNLFNRPSTVDTTAQEAARAQSRQVSTVNVVLNQNNTFNFERLDQLVTKNELVGLINGAVSEGLRRAGVTSA